MKNTFVRMTVTILSVITVLFSSLPAPSRLEKNPPAVSSLEMTLESLCNCVRNPTWIPTALDRSLRPVIAPQLDPTILPVDVSLKAKNECVNCSNCFDCYAWQLFIALNWPAVSPGVPKLSAKVGFGHAGDTNAVVWETYKSVYDIFEDPKRKKLPAWGQSNRSKLLQATSAVVRKSLVDEQQSDQKWLTDQNKELVRYETRVNKDVYEYIRNNCLHNQEGIYKAFTDPAKDGISLPDGSAFKSGEPGSIEIKAAWRIVPPGKLTDFQQRYKISYARIPGKGSNVAIALVGLHIIKKTPNSPQFIWATFEHKDNAPDIQEHPAPESKWNFYHPTAGDNIVPNWHTPPEAEGPNRTRKTKPVQVKREVDFQIANGTKSINTKVHNLIRAPFPNSIWLNYVLVVVQWPQQPVKQPHKATDILAHGDPSPHQAANLAMETYLQRNNSGGLSERGQSSCIGCHRHTAYTPIFKIPGGSDKRWWTDYSTIFSKAKAKNPTR
jgi:hypothetical protein